MNKQTLNLVAAFACGFVAVAAGLFVYQEFRGVEPPPDDLPILWPNPKQLHDFNLPDQHGAAFDLARVKGKWTFWFFGYTNCPDVCPVTLSVMNDIDKRLASFESLQQRTQAVFVSVDPERDTHDRLRQYVGFFNPQFIAATSDDAALETLTKQFGILSLRQPADETGSYLVDHTAGILLTDPQARFVAVFSAPHQAETIEQQFRRISAFIDAQ